MPNKFYTLCPCGNADPNHRHAGDLLLMSKDELRVRVRELLVAEDIHVAEINRLRALVASLGIAASEE